MYCAKRQNRTSHTILKFDHLAINSIIQRDIP